MVASNFSPRNPSTSLPTSDLPVCPPANRPKRQLAIQPMSLPSTLQPSSPPTGGPAHHASKPVHPQRITSTSTTYVPIHHESPANLQLAPSNQPTHFPLLNRMTPEMRCPPRDHHHRHNAPPDSSPTEPPATFCAKPCNTASALDSPMPQPTQSRTCFPNITSSTLAS